MKGSMYAKGLVLTLFGGAGLAENITSGRGSFMLCAIIFSIGFGTILASYVYEKNNHRR